MGGSLGDLSVSFRADITNLTQGAQKAQEEIRKVGTTAAETSSKMEGGFGKSIKEAGGSLLNFGSQLTMVAFGLKSLVESAISAGEAMLAPSAAMEQAQVTMETLMGSTQAAQGELKQLWDFAANTPFEFPDVEAAGAKLLAVGFAAQDVIPDLTAIGDALSALGQATGADLQGVVTVFGQMHNTGHLMAQDMMQLTDRGIPAWRLLSEQMHLSVAELQQMTSKGLIPADQAINALTKGMEATFGGGMQKQSQTFLGLLSTFKDNITAAWRAMTGPAFEAAKAGLQELGSLVSSKSFQEFATLLGQAIAPVVKDIGQDVANVAEQFQKWLSNKKNIEDYSNLVHALAMNIKKVADEVGPAYQDFMKWNEQIGLIKNNTKDAIGQINGMSDALKNVIPIMFDVAKAGTGVLQLQMWTWGKIAAGVTWFVNQIIQAYDAIAQMMGWAQITQISMTGMTDITNAPDLSGIPSHGSSGGPSRGSSPGTGISGTGGTGTGSGRGRGTGRGRKPPAKKKKPTATTGTGGVVAPPGAGSSSSGIGGPSTGSGGNNFLIVIEIDGQVFMSKIVQGVYDQVRLRLGPQGIQAI